MAIPVLEEVAGYVGFDEADAGLLMAAAPHVRPLFHTIVEHFYEAIEASPGASSVLNGPAQVERLKGTLVDWLEGLFSGVYDEAYFDRRARIGRMHVRIGLAQRYMFSAMNLIRAELHEAVDASRIERASQNPTHRAIDRICDIELAIMLETYREAYIEQLTKKERLATLGELAAGIGHDLRNPLAVIETSLHLIEKRVVGDARAEKHLDRIRTQVSISNAIITDLLELARDRPAERQPTRVTDLVAQALASMPANERVTMVTEIADDVDAATIDPGQIRQLLVNLVLNAAQAVSREGRSGHVWVRVARRGGDLVLTVDDDGAGIATEVLPHIFEPLFTTRARGIGLGLSICRRIVEKHEGTITAEPRGEGGARFVTVLPFAFTDSEAS